MVTLLVRLGGFFGGTSAAFFSAVPDFEMKSQNNKIAYQTLSQVS